MGPNESRCVVAYSNGGAGNREARLARMRRRRRGWALTAVALLACASGNGDGLWAESEPVMGATPGEPLRATWLGRVGESSGPSLAVAWKRPGSAQVEIFDDADGDRRRDPGERLLAERRVSTAVEVVELPAGTRRDALALTWRGELDETHGSLTLDGVPATGSLECAWQPGFFLDDLDNEAEAMAVWDDGSGSALYVGGYFVRAGGVTVNRIAKWDGTAWSALSGPSGTGASGPVLMLTTWGDSNGEALYVGGAFSTAGGVSVNSIAKWDGASWSALSGPSGTGTNGVVLALAKWGDGNGAALYVGGSFSTAGGVPVNHIAKWDGASWSALSGPSGVGTDGYVRACAVWDDGSGEALYVGGDFVTAGGIAVNSIAAWDATGWSALSGPSGVGVDASVWSLAVWDDGSGAALFAGGAFWTAGGVPVSGIARWDAAGWSALSGPSGLGVGGSVYSLAAWDDGSGAALYAGGDFEFAGGVLGNRIARWDGTGWSALNGPSGVGVDSAAYALVVWDDGSGESLYAGGFLELAGGVPVNHIARWSGSAWSMLGGPSGTGTTAGVNALVTWDDGSGEVLYAGGDFMAVGGVLVNSVAKWDGTVWSALSGPSGTGASGSVLALATWDDGNGEALYVGGIFSTAGGIQVNNIAKWDGASWSALSGASETGTVGPVWALATWDDGSGESLYAGGDFGAAGGVLVNSVAKWDGTVWSALSGPSGTGASGSVLALATWDDGNGEALYVGGSFSTAGGVSVNSIARWNGASWSALVGLSGSGTDGNVRALAVWNDGSGAALYAGGDFVTAGGVTVNSIAKWDGASWSALSGPAGTGTAGGVVALATWDDGNGEALCAGGGFPTAGGLLMNRISQWDGTGGPR